MSATERTKAEEADQQVKAPQNISSPMKLSYYKKLAVCVFIRQRISALLAEENCAVVVVLCLG